MSSEPPGKRQDGPFVAHCAPGKYAYCACGRSARYPYCDGSHRATGEHPLKIVLDQARTVAWCACGRSAAKPYCDGSHGRR